MTLITTSLPAGRSFDQAGRRPVLIFSVLLAALGLFSVSRFARGAR
jgi:hypothetical protein